MEEEKVDEETAKKMNNFSVALGLFDYINPIFYAITTFTIIKNFSNLNVVKPWNIFFIVGAVISLIFGMTIPTVKFIVGLGKMKFKMPVNLVFFVNTGILISGLALLKIVMKIKTWLLILILFGALILLGLIYLKSRKFNTVAVLIGAIGYILLYIILINLAVKTRVIVSIILYCLAICFFVSLCLIGIKANLKDARVHWVIEISNVLCQASVAISTIILFK